MSRCFPFPPPGYEKKISTDDASDSLLKEKQKKEKKHKKDKEKKEGKEKKDKETSKDKHKDRKEKKEKHKDKKKDKEKSRTTSENKKAAVAGVPQNTTGEKEKKVVTNTVLSNGESKFIQDLARRIRDDEKATDSQSVGKISIPNGVRDNNNPISQNNHRKVDEKRSYATEKRSENGLLRVSSSTDQKGSEFMAKPSEKKKTEPQEKNHRKESVMKPLDSEGIKRNESKYTTANKKSEVKEEKTEAINNKTGHDKPKYGEGGPRLKDRDVVDTSSFRVHDDLSKASSKNLTADGVLGKRKDLETNGFLYENGSRPNKIHRSAASPVTSVENGRKLQTLPKPVTELQGPHSPVCKPEVKEHRVNGFIDSQEPKNRPTTCSSSSVKVKENGEAKSKKRPHTDLKYLDQILNVPQREELHEVGENEEQEWLFGQSVKLLKKPKTDSTTVSLDESLQVWNQALRLGSADTVALPYVVPF